MRNASVALHIKISPPGLLDRTEQLAKLGSYRAHGDRPSFQCPWALKTSSGEARATKSKIHGPMVKRSEMAPLMSAGVITANLFW